MLYPKNTKINLINFTDHRQDVHKIREHDPNQNRYRIAETLLPFNPNGISVLDLGGGIAEFSRRMIARGFNVTFVDLNKNNIQKAESIGVKAFHLDLNLGLTIFENNSFDGVIMLEIIEHIVAAEFLLEEVNRVLKPGGFLILSTPNFAFFKNRLRILLGNLSDDEGYHYRFFTVRTLRYRLKKANFIIEVSHHTMPAFIINFLRNRILGFPRLHVHIPNFLAPLFAYTLIIKARKMGIS